MIELSGKSSTWELFIINKLMNVLGISAGNGVNLFPFKRFVSGNIELRSDYTINKKPDQFKLNFPSAFFDTKLRCVDPPIDIIIGNPKCGSSSMLALSRGKTFKSHKGEPSLDLYFAAVTKYQPRIFLLENLPKLLESYSEDDLNTLYPNYLLTIWVGSMFELGNSQKNRKRLIITGVKKTSTPFASRVNGLLRNKFQVTTPQLTQELLVGVPDNGHFRPPLGERIALYGGTQKTYKEIQALWASIFPATRIKTPDETFNTAPGVYRDASDKHPSTIRKSNRCFNPWGLSYTPRERARIQGIPDSFKILHSGHSDKTLFNKGCVTTGSTPSYEVGLWFYTVLKDLFKDL